MESVLGNWLPIPQGAGDGPFPGRGLYWSRSRRARCQALRGGPPPPVRFRLPSPSPADAAPHALCLLLFSCCGPLCSPREEPTGWQLSRNLLSPSWVPTPPLISAWTPCARVGPLRDLAPAKAAPVCASHLRGPSSPRLITLVLQGLRPGKGEVRDRPGRGEEWPQERQKLRVGWLQGENNSMEPPLQAS